MKRVFLISLLALILLQSFGKVFIVLDYQLRKDYIMEFLCINRDKPELQCEGKCHLKKQLKKSEQSDKQANEKARKQELPVTLYCQALFRLPALDASYTAAPSTPFRQGHPLKVTYSIFHPPRYAA